MMRLFFIGSIPGHVPGSGQTPSAEDAQLFNAASQLGYFAAERGHTVIVGSDSKNTVDYYIMEGIQRFCKEDPNRKASVEIHRPEGTRAPYQEVPENLRLSRVSYEQDAQSSYMWIVTHVRALDSCDVLITMGGGASTRVIGTIAADRQIPVVAIATFGGSSAELYEKLKYVYKNRYSITSSLHHLADAWNNSTAENVIGLIEAIGKPAPALQPHSYFISYSWADSGIADHIEVLLRRSNRKVFRDEDGISAGSGLSNAVVVLIQECDTFIAIYGKNYMSSSWCPKELEYARKRKDRGLKPSRIVLISIDETEPPLLFMDTLRIPATNRSSSHLAVLKLLHEES